MNGQIIDRTAFGVELVGSNAGHDAPELAQKMFDGLTPRASVLGRQVKTIRLDRTPLATE